jgi:ectoine hydroxylase-related dioxygenase (phytanoyl-CoA dioxygenase family)
MSTNVLKGMNDAEKYIFDCNGYIVLRGVFTEEEVASANTAIDNHITEKLDRHGVLRNTRDGTLMSGDGASPRMDLGGLLTWGEDSTFFRNVLAHPRLVPYFNDLLGKGYRMDHLPFCILQDKGSEGFSLHGGMVDVESGKYNPFLAYSCVQGQINNCLLACSVVLSDHNAGDGGFCVVRGSHKANFAAPVDMINGDAYQEFLIQPETKAGDVVLFSESTVHGALPWRADHQRRIALYRFAPSTMAYGRTYWPAWPEAMTNGMDEAQLAVMQPPYAMRLDRKALTVAGDSGEIGVDCESRNPRKKEFDKEVHGTDYF